MFRIDLVTSHVVSREDSTNSPPDRLVVRLLVVRSLAALGLAAPLWPSWQRCTLWNEVPVSVARGIIAALKPDHHVKFAAQHNKLPCTSYEAPESLEPSKSWLEHV
ncbi:hypothetical protein T265_08311 [Opisthorchis viverrini]|uniref:Uncharacterized protein n=1 Tax=Opisthorchis viverrini TaxID=6198 RepID=A0A074ZE18_OPIVI|nr:hypothetical protein T265_08311 [Opisthorchis viverrini]KER23892.1 hypothetical protein T265_08311 [Opisthorchis viverrini]